jgi:hypothetical protein
VRLKDGTEMQMPWEEHADCRWVEVPPCVYCDDHNVRLYQGTIPPEKDPALAAKRAACVHVWDEERGLGFYFICKLCGFKEWAE